MRQATLGYTLVELLVGMGILAVLFSVASLPSLRTQQSATVDSAVATLLSDLHRQQLAAMIGVHGQSAQPSSFGIFLESSQYTLFSHPFATGSASNQVVSVPGLTLSTTFPDATVLFASGSGLPIRYASASARITITSGTVTKTVRLHPSGRFAVE